MPLPIGFFMPLPLPIMIPFMMWQSAAIAAGFGTYFQFAKRRVSAMSNEEFNKADPHELVNSMYEDIVKQIPSSFSKVDSLTPVMLQSMNVMLDQAVKWLQGAITGNFFGTPNPVNEPIDNFGEPTPELTVELLNPTFAEVKQFTNTKINLIVARQLHLYTSQSQSFINSENQRRNPVTETPPVIPINERIPTQTVQSVIGKLRAIDWSPISQLIINSILRATNASELMNKSNSVFASFQGTQATSCRRNNSGTACRVATNNLNKMLRFLTVRNQLLSAELPFNI